MSTQRSQRDSIRYSYQYSPTTRSNLASTFHVAPQQARYSSIPSYETEFPDLEVRLNDNGNPELDDLIFLRPIPPNVDRTDSTTYAPYNADVHRHAGTQFIQPEKPSASGHVGSPAPGSRRRLNCIQYYPSHPSGMNYANTMQQGSHPQGGQQTAAGNVELSNNPSLIHNRPNLLTGWTHPKLAHDIPNRPSHIARAAPASLRHNHMSTMSATTSTSSSTTPSTPTSSSGTQGMSSDGKVAISRTPGGLRSPDRGADAGVVCPHCNVPMRRPNSLPRHLRTKHGMAKYHYHCMVLGCPFWHLRKDKVQKHCREAEKQGQGKERVKEVESELALLSGNCEVSECEWLARTMEICDGIISDARW